MTVEEIRITFPKRLRFFLETSGKTQQELADYVGVGKSIVSQWVNGKKMPNISRIDKICEFFGGIYRSDLLNEKDYTDEDYYLNAETRRLAKEAFENPDVRMLFDATRRISPEDMKAVIEIARRLGK